MAPGHLVNKSLSLVAKILKADERNRWSMSLSNTMLHGNNPIPKKMLQQQMTVKLDGSKLHCNKWLALNASLELDPNLKEETSSDIGTEVQICLDQLPTSPGKTSEDSLNTWPLRE